MSTDQLEKRVILTERTLLPVSVLIALGTCVFFAAGVYSLANENRQMIEEVKDKRFTVDKRIFDQLNRLSEKTNKIDGKVDILIKMQKN